MAKSFTSQDIKNIVKLHNELLKKLYAVKNNPNILVSTISKCADKFISQEIMTILRSVSVDELNKDKKGIRVKALHDSGVDTIADVVSMSRYNLEAIRGISADASYTIKHLADKFAQEAKRNVKLSIDNRDKISSDLVSEISKYRNYLPICDEVNEILHNNERTIKELISDVSNGSNIIKWMFSSKSKKQKTEEAYKALNDLFYGEYGAKCNSTFRTSNNVLN